MGGEKPAMYRNCVPVVDTKYERGARDSAAKVVVDAVAEAADCSPLDLPPLYEFVAPDAVKGLLEYRDLRDSRMAVLGFEMQDWIVFVRADGRVRVCDTSQPAEPAPVFEGQV